MHTWYVYVIKRFLLLAKILRSWKATEVLEDTDKSDCGTHVNFYEFGFPAYYLAL